MKTITMQDTLHVTVLSRGCTIANVNFSGCLSFADVISRLRRLGIRLSGLVSLVLRNATRGWTQTHSLLFAAA